VAGAVGSRAGRGIAADARPPSSHDRRLGGCFLAENIFWVPKETRWDHIQANAKQPTIGQIINDATLDEIRGHDYVLTPGRYVGIEDIEDDDEPFEEKIERLIVKLEAQFAESSRLEVAIRKNLQRLAGQGDS
jgi:type I restriction-modification system DNA methylase subunit